MLVDDDDAAFGKRTRHDDAILLYRVGKCEFGFVTRVSTGLLLN
jgi:hypothetical protein